MPGFEGCIHKIFTAFPASALKDGASHAALFLFEH
jgi:hypothetical protein